MCSQKDVSGEKVRGTEVGGDGARRRLEKPNPERS